MKRFFLILLPFLVLFLNSCTSNIPVSPEITIQYGSVALNFDRTNKPANIMSVTAYLTRAGFDSLSGTLNLLSDTTADISFDDIAAGNWHLRVDAADENEIVVYTGEKKDINILAGITTEVYLTLLPTGAGFGNIHIVVTWGEPANYDWIDYENNPVFTNSGSPYGINGVGNPHLIIENGVYKMWYKNLENNGVGSIGYAESSDGISWVKMEGAGSSHPGLLVPGMAGWLRQVLL